VNLLENREGQRLLISGVHSSTTKEELKHLAMGGAVRLLRRSRLRGGEYARQRR